MMLEHILSGLDTADKAVTLALNFDGGPVADAFFHGMSCSLAWIPLALLFIYLIYKDGDGGWRRVCPVLLGLVVTVVLCDHVSSEIVKPLAMRPRPSHDLQICHMLHYVGGYRGGRYGFVSSHAANAFGAVAYCCMLARRKWFAVVSTAFAVTVSYSRIYLGVHYLGDVVGGALFGVMVGLAIYGTWHVSRKKVLTNGIIDKGRPMKAP